MVDLYDIGKVEGAVKEKLYRDSELYALVDGRIYTGLELEDVPARLTNDNMALLSVNYGSDITTPFHGSGASHMASVKGFIQIDIASRKNKQLVRQCIAAVKGLLYNNVDITVGPRTFALVVDDLPALVSYDKDIAAFHGAIKFQIYYEATME